MSFREEWRAATSPSLISHNYIQICKVLINGHKVGTFFENDCFIFYDMHINQVTSFIMLFSFPGYSIL